MFASLIRQEVGSKAGTTSESTPVRTGEYDVALAGLIPIVYKYFQVMPRPVSDHIIGHLLNKIGGPDDSDHWVIVPGISETENHIWQIESSRYLTNELLFRRTGDPKYDNTRNGEEKYILERLGDVLRTDFIE
jgi:hypothetical protein